VVDDDQAEADQAAPLTLVVNLGLPKAGLEGWIAKDPPVGL